MEIDGGDKRFSAPQDATAPTTPWSHSLCDKASVAIAEIPYTLKIGAHVITHDRHLCYHCWLSEGVIREKSVKLTMSTLGLSRPTEFLEGTGYREWYPPITIGAEIRTAICR